MTKSSGRPTVMTEGTLRKLEEAFLLGCTDSEACLHADIGTSTLYDYCSKNKEFSERKEVLKQRPILLARQVIMKALESNDISTAHKVIDRKDGKKINHSGHNGGEITIVFEGIESKGCLI